MALASICLSVSIDIHIYARMQGKHGQHYEKISLTYKNLHQCKLCGAKIEKRNNMINQADYIKTLSEHLDTVGDPIQEKHLVIVLIRRLPEEYNHVITALETIAEQKHSWNSVRDRVIYEHEKLICDIEAIDAKIQ